MKNLKIKASYFSARHLITNYKWNKR